MTATDELSVDDIFACDTYFRLKGSKASLSLRVYDMAPWRRTIIKELEVLEAKNDQEFKQEYKKKYKTKKAIKTQIHQELLALDSNRQRVIRLSRTDPSALTPEDQQEIQNRNCSFDFHRRLGRRAEELLHKRKETLDKEFSESFKKHHQRYKRLLKLKRELSGETICSFCNKLRERVTGEIVIQSDDDE
jgi:hypothetical protein